MSLADLFSGVFEGVSIGVGLRSMEDTTSARFLADCFVPLALTRVLPSGVFLIGTLSFVSPQIVKATLLQSPCLMTNILLSALKAPRLVRSKMGRVYRRVREFCWRLMALSSSSGMAVLACGCAEWIVRIVSGALRVGHIPDAVPILGVSLLYCLNVEHLDCAARAATPPSIPQRDELPSPSIENISSPTC